MLPQIADFKAEADALNTLLESLQPADWARATLFKAWTINDVILHLHAGDLLAAASAEGPEHFAQMRAATQALRDAGLSRVEAERQRFAGLSGPDLRQRWYAQAAALCDRLAGMPADTRLAWAGPSMGLRMFTTARQMETWAHGQAIYDVMGRTRAPADRLRNIAEIGVRTYGWTFANRGLPLPGPAPFVRLAGPTGTVWEWNEPATDNRIEGSALAFCQVVTQVRHIADTDLAVRGEPALAWMRIAQCFAGPPEEPPPPGTRVAVPPATQV